MPGGRKRPPRSPFSLLAQVPIHRLAYCDRPAGESSTPAPGAMPSRRAALATPGTEKPATCEMRRCSSSRRGVLSSNCSDRVNSPRLIEWRDERLRGAIAIGAAILPPSAKAGWSTALADLKRWESRSWN